MTSTRLPQMGLFAALLCGGCAPSDGVFTPEHPGIRYVGRFDFTDSSQVRFDWPGAYLEARFEGTSCRVRLLDGGNDYNVYIDGVPTEVLVTTTDTTYVLAEGLPDSTHTLRLVKRTEASFGVATFLGLELDPGRQLLPIPEGPARRLLFIGDSYVAGYGIEGADPSCPYGRETENNEAAYGPLLAQRLGADYMVIAKSGAGVVRNYGSPKRVAEDPFPVYYPRTLQNDSTSVWTPEVWQPDLVVVRLGRNDFTTRPRARTTDFRNAYRALLTTLQTDHPQATILALCGPGRAEPYCAHVQRTVREMKRTGLAPRLHFHRIPNVLIRPRDFGCNWHPNRAGHQKIADALEPVLRKLMQWPLLPLKVS